MLHNYGSALNLSNKKAALATMTLKTLTMNHENKSQTNNQQTRQGSISGRPHKKPTVCQ